ncbi:aminopeptidase O-like isoform X1 [Cynoglossus semilaevis]|uniref:aminopeptidase O-like isoform X1 n=1 Tax=Cynoglossus semilaevis TaxID=244447 RepID=UPI0007DCA886|nr:aminopeptidase O-like isoform X1 [Cynoglossus semilaevis]
MNLVCVCVCVCVSVLCAVSAVFDLSICQLMSRCYSLSSSSYTLKPSCPVSGLAFLNSTKEFTSEQLVMLLELLLEKSDLSGATMQALQRTYSLQCQDAEVRHRWCELVVKHGHCQAYGDVEHFLIHDQAMGVYLYGELMVHEAAEQQALAYRCLSLVQEGMDQSARRVVEEMIL